MVCLLQLSLLLFLRVMVRLTGTVFCLGGSPEEIQGDIKSKLDGKDESNIQNELIQHFSSLASDSCPVDLSEELLKQQIFEDKVRLCIQKLQGQIPFNSQYLTDLLKSAYARIGFVRDYKFNHPHLKANVILIRALPDMASNFPVSASYKLLVSMNYAPDDIECPAIINRHLKPHVIEHFYDTNLCESYLMNNEDAFMKFGLLDP
ncbi:Uncharacterized protein OBRU01_04580 [Operophtera brumata]|uniref:Uncharacterized protein n=1 Tax=Operophtera brumata TaxID=104452 RepID=A0A0L7LNY1_OPEBR|nr:Uncharacterized protein OBRU01_04580 [Operophtera brumata]